MIYGRATLNGSALPAGQAVSLKVGADTLVSYVMGSDADLGQLYALRVPLDTVGSRLPGYARSGDAARVYFGEQLAAILVIGPAGATQALDLDPAALVAGIVAGDLSVVEGDAGSATVQLPITITQVAAVAVEVDFITRNGSASSSSDYTPRLGRAIVPAGATQTTIAIQIAGDPTIESDEDFFIDLSAPLNGVLLDPEGRVVILDDDTPPAISIGDITVNEPNPGATQQVSFAVQLSHIWDANVSVSYAAFSPPGGAVNGTDFTLNPGTLVIPAGQVTRQIQLNILGDLIDENDEVFELRLASPVNASIADPPAPAPSPTMCGSCAGSRSTPTVPPPAAPRRASAALSTSPSDRATGSFTWPAAPATRSWPSPAPPTAASSTWPPTKTASAAFPASTASRPCGSRATASRFSPPPSTTTRWPLFGARATAP